MILEVRYPECVERQLAELDDRILSIYRQYVPETAISLDYKGFELLKKQLFDLANPLFSEKARIVTNSCPTYVIHLEEDQK